MKTPRWLSSVIAISLLVGSGGLVPPLRAQDQVSGLGDGARFLPPDTAFYLTGNLGPQSPQLTYLDRLAEFYVSAPELDSARRQFSQALRPFGPYRDVGELWADASPWLGNEAFLAFRSRQDLMDATASSSSFDRVKPDCQDVQFMAGVAIGDWSAFHDFLDRYSQSLEEQGVRRDVEDIDGTQVLVLGGSPEGGNVFATVKDSYVLFSPSRALITDAIAGQPAGGLAGTESFRTARARVGADALAMLYVDVPDQTLGFGGGGFVQSGSTQWVAAGVRLTSASVRVDVTSVLDATRLTPASRALLTKKPNPLQSASVVPRETSFYVGWDNLKLLWQSVKAEIGTQTYEQDRQHFIEQTGIDPDADVFDWMTGEFSVFSSQSDATDRLGMGMLVQANNPDLARSKLRKIIDAIPRVAPELNISTEDIGGVSFFRISIGSMAIYTQVVEGWLVIGSGSQIAMDTAVGIRGNGGLNMQSEASAVRLALPHPMQFFGYINVPAVSAVTTSGVGAIAGETDVAGEVQEYSQPIRSVGLGVHTTENQISGTFYAHVEMPAAAPPRPIAQAPRIVNSHEVSVLIDASKHGGAWWAPDEEPHDLTWRRNNPETAMDDSAPALPSRGAPMAVYLHDQVGIGGFSTLLPGERVGLPAETVNRGAFATYMAPTPDENGILVPTAPLTMRVGSDGTYEPSEIAAYQGYVRCGGKLLLMSDGKSPGEIDELADAFGMRVAGTARGAAAITELASHPLTDGAEPLSARGGTGLIAWDEATTPLAYYSRASYLDLDGNGFPSAGDVSGAPAMAVRPYGRGVVVFIGTTLLVQEPQHPLMHGMLRQLLADATWPGPIVPDEFEPDDMPGQAMSLFEDGPREHSIHGPDDVDWFQFEGQENTEIRVYADSLCPISLALFDSDGETQLDTPHIYSLRATLPSTGTYFVRASREPSPWATCRTYSLVTTTVAPSRLPGRG